MEMHKINEESAMQHSYFRNAQSKKMEKAQLKIKPGLIVTVGKVQAQNETDQVKAVVGRVHPGCGRTGVQLHRRWGPLGLASSGGL